MNDAREVIARHISAAGPYGSTDAWERRGDKHRARCLRSASAILAALAEAGLAVVPQRPTTKMREVVLEAGGHVALGFAMAAWPDMLAAAEGARDE
jgi:hypothetical protein